MTNGCEDGCPFTDAESELIGYGEHQYCRLHLPHESEDFDPSRFAQRFTALQQANRADFSGVHFPGHTRYDFVRPINLRECKFGDGVHLVFNNVGGDLTGSQFLGRSNTLSISNAHDVSLQRCKFVGDFRLDAGGSRGVFDFTGAKFEAENTFSAVDGLKRLIFVGAAFAATPTFPDTTNLPPKTRFNGALFRMRADDESAFRAIRNFFNNQRARDWEGRFYAYEKRCQRLGMVRPREWVPRILSALYDLSSEYGYSYGRALSCFLAVQLVFGLVYAAMSNRLALGGAFDGTVVAFTFAQVVKPFELFGARAGENQFIPAAREGWWLALTAAQSVLSITLVALFLLALRWRFRRE